MKMFYLILLLAGIFVILTAVPFLAGPDSIYTVSALAGLIVGIALVIFGIARLLRAMKKQPPQKKP
ncbi:MAG TPA: hypothetical protein VN328_10870 [Thermodesulfovibrionales bacterium]|nr:hypothetical protein [Thermodesulfovibrionales bacterium]